ncbi:MAG: DUF3536 domain-containing protein [Acidimicrobiia bacterium]|nr:DUF3536 domain-containing protein [Acidimicrobiia bacterium]
MAVCVHAHCYQPPREDPATGEVPAEETAAPFHDWNARITEECYRPLAAARITDDGAASEEVVNLYGLLDFNVAPTLGLWLDRFAPDVAAAMASGDRSSCERFGGHGGAISHPWVHAILPLTSVRDRTTLVRWGIAEFEHRFGRRPEGMWLPETAIDAATLETLAAHGISFTIVAPHQVATTDGSPRPVDEPLSIRLASGRSISVFVYDGALAHGVAFGGLLADGERLAAEIVGGAEEGHGRLRSFATDAETFGHHHVFGEMGLAWALRRVEATGHEVVPYAAWLARVGPGTRGAVVDGTSWSCAHGLERWRSDCGCRAGFGSDPDQHWRTPLREAIDWTVERFAELTDEHAGTSLVDAWMARDAWVDVLTGRRSMADWVDEQVRSGGESDRAVAWMEAHRHLLMAQSSCAWFFDDADGHETRIGMRWARSAIDRLRDLTGIDLSPGWEERIAPMWSGETVSPRRPSGSS